MRPETLPLVSDFKKEYKFLWLISVTDFASSQTKNVNLSVGSTNMNFQTNLGTWMKDVAKIDGIEFFQKVVCNSAFSSYISQLAETVNIPDDEFEIETIQQGPVDYQMPKRVKMDDILVTYLDDSLESVYNFHKSWFQAIRCGKSIGINSPSLFSASAKYIPFEDTMLATEYALFKNKWVQYLTSAAASNKLMPSLPIGAKPTSIITYPKLFPKKIHRTPANHSGNDVARVDVTYSRIPTFEKKHTPLQMWDGTKWNNTNNSDIQFFK